MSTFKYWESELEGLKDASARLERDYQTQSEAVKIDLRRRYDQAIAVAFRAKSIWAGAEVQISELGVDAPWARSRSDVLLSFHLRCRELGNEGRS